MKGTHVSYVSSHPLICVHFHILPPTQPFLTTKSDLELIIEVYLHPLRASHMLTEDQIHTLFSDLEILLNFNKIVCSPPLSCYLAILLPNCFPSFFFKLKNKLIIHLQLKAELEKQHSLVDTGIMKIGSAFLTMVILFLYLRSISCNSSPIRLSPLFPCTLLLSPFVKFDM